MLTFVMTVRLDLPRASHDAVSDLIGATADNLMDSGVVDPAVSTSQDEAGVAAEVEMHWTSARMACGSATWPLRGPGCSGCCRSHCMPGCVHHGCVWV